MAAHNELGREIVLSYLDNPDNHNLNKTELARLIYNENKEVFTSIENVRTSVRYFSGAKGKIQRETAAKRYDKFFNNKYKFPESDSQEWRPFILPKSCNNILILSDIHIPYHDVNALELAFDYGLKHKVNTIYLNGDIIDFYGISRWEKDPRKRKFHQELEDGRNFLTILRDVFPNASIFYKIGNHEERYESYLKTKAPELLEIEDFKLDVLLKFGEKHITLIESRQLAKAGKLTIMHGHEFGRSVFSPVNPARGFYMRAKESMLGGHHHQTSEHSERSLHDSVVTTYSTGCLCELHPEYLPINKWNVGFAHVTIEDNGAYFVQNKRIIKNKIY